MNKVEDFKETSPHSVGTGKVFEGNSRLDVTEETYQDRNVNFRKYVKGLMLGMMAHSDYKTLNLQAKTYDIKLRLSIVPEVPGRLYTNEMGYFTQEENTKQKIVVPEKKIEVV